MKILNRCVIIFLFPFFVSITSKGQSLQYVNTIKINSPSLVSTGFNHIYIANQNGDIIKYDTSGKQINIFSPENAALTYSLEAFFPLKTFIFNKDAQSYLFLDKQFNPSSDYQLLSSQIDYIDLATYDGSQSLWLVDIGNLSLLKYDLDLNTVTNNTALQNHIPDEVSPMNFIKTHQHHVYINHKNIGIMVFDDLGNYIKTLPHKDLDYFGFINDEIYFLQNNTLIFKHLYKGQQRTIQIDSNKKYKFALVFSHRIFLFTEEDMEGYKIME